MCTYGIGLPFDHPIWRNLPPCRCGGNAVQPSITQPFTVPSMPVGPALANGPYKCPDCGTWFQGEHRCAETWTNTGTDSARPFTPTHRGYVVTS